MVVVLIGALAGAAVAAGGYAVATQDEAEAQQADVGGRTIDAHLIYQQITGGPGGRSLVDGQQAAATLQSRYAERANRIAELNKKMAANWTGEGGAGAARGAEPLKVWMEDSSSNLGHASAALDDQYGAFTTVSGKVRPVPARPPESHFLNDLAPWETDLDEEIQRYNEDARTNVDAFNVYYQSSTTNAQQMPAYSTMQGQYGNIDVDTGPGSCDGYGGSPPGSYAPSGMGGAGGGSYSAASGPASSVGPGGAGGASYGPGGGYGGSYGGPGYGNSHDNPPGYGTPEWGGGTGTGTASYMPPSSNVPGIGSNTGFGPGTGGHGSGGYGTGSYGAGGSYGGGYGAAGGAYGGGGYSGYGPRGSGSPSAGAASGTAPPGSSSATGGYPGARAGSTASSATGRPMMGPMGGGRGQGGEDEEHERKYLIEEDANELFGTDQKTPPPVIGE